MRTNSVGNVAAVNLHFGEGLLEQGPLERAATRQSPSARDKHDGRGALRCKPTPSEKPKPAKATCDHMCATHFLDMRGQLWRMHEPWTHLVLAALDAFRFVAARRE